MTLGSYDGIEIVQYTYDITDEMVQEQIDAARQDAATEEEKSDPSTTGDIVYVTLKSSVKDVADSEESEDTYFTIGDADYGEDFDAALTGVSTGDEKTFSIDFDDDFWIDTWAGHTVNTDKLLRCDRRAVPGCRGRYYLQRLSAGALRFLQGGCSLRLYGLRRR